MSAKPKPAQSEFFEDSLPVKPSAETPPIRLADLKNDQLPSGRPSLGNSDPLGSLGRLEPLAFARYLITFSIGMAVALAWQSYGIATSVAASQEQMTRSIDRLVAGQEQTTREISDLQTVEQYILERLATLQTRLAPTTASKPVP